jgi:hypothetical protein
MENFITRRKALGLAAASLASPYLITRASAAAAPVLVELFTSQGCSSCPAADRLAAELKNYPGVTVISFNVDYWDYLGWKDTLAKPEFTKRQMDYAHARGDNKVYTPQMVFNGATHAVGSNNSEVSDAIAKAASQSIALQIKATAKDITIDLPKAASNGEATLWLMAIAPQISVKIERGENSGSTIVYHNVVRRLVKAGTWNGEAAKISMAKTDIALPDCKTCIAVLQQDELGPMIGMAKLDSIGA